MVLSCEAWKLRDAARGALVAGQLEIALRLAGKAQRTHRAPAGEALMAVSLLLQKSPGLNPPPL